MALQKVSREMVEEDVLTGMPPGAKGDLFVRHEDGSVARVQVGGDGEVLTAASSAPEGVAWAAAGVGGGGGGSRIVGEIITAALAAAPALFLACDGLAVSRTTYADLFAAIGTSFGAGDGVNTFNVPDLRGRAPVGQGTGLSRAGIASVIIATDTINLQAAQDWKTGAALVYTTTGLAIDGLAGGNTYYWIRLTSTSGKLASSRANALAGTAINLLDVGTGTQTLQANLSARAVGEIGGEEAHALTVNEIPAHTHTNGYAVGGASAGTDLGRSVGSTGSTGGSQEHNTMQPFAVVGFFIYAGV
jgi:microcystin-dependent protein